MPRRPRLPEGVRERVRAGGRVVFEARWRDRSGARHSRSFATAEEAIAHLHAQANAKRRGGSGNPTGGQRLLSDYLPSWWRGRVDRNEIRGSTAAQNLSNLNAHLIPDLGHWRLGELTAHDVNDWTAKLATSLAPSTVAKCYQILNTAFEHAVRDELIMSNPVRRAATPQVPDEEARFCTLDEVAAIEAAMRPWWRLLVPYMVDTAQRIGEVSAVLVNQVTVDLREDDETVRGVTLRDAAHDLDRVVGGTVWVRWSAADVPLGISGATQRRQITDTKSRKGKRMIPTLTASTTRRLVEQVADRRQALSCELFAGPRGGPLDPRNLRDRHWVPAVERAGVAEPRPTFHALRHTGISMWLEAGVQPYRVAHYAGHTDAEMQRIYGHLMPHDASEARLALDVMRSR